MDGSLFGAGGASTAAAAGNIPLSPLLLMKGGETCCAMTLISKEKNAKPFYFSFFFFAFPHLLNSAPNANRAVFGLGCVPASRANASLSRTSSLPG